MGSFLCTCRPGFRLRADRVSCEGERLAPPQALGPAPSLPALSRSVGRQGASSFRRNFFSVHLLCYFLHRSFILSVSFPFTHPSFIFLSLFPQPYHFPPNSKGGKNPHQKATHDREAFDVGVPVTWAPRDTADSVGSVLCHGLTACLSASV